MGKPVLAVNRGSHDLASHNNHQAEPIGVPHREPCPRMQIHFRVYAKSSGRGVRCRHLRQRPHHWQRNHSADKKAYDDRRSGQLYGNRADEKESGSDRRPKSDHRDLSRTQLAVKSRLALDGSCRLFNGACFDVYVLTHRGATMFSIYAPTLVTVVRM